ncbi:MAG: hypothetical protein LBT44_10240 [Clostridiales bacterium]|jgi:hypothetical protein|nr:hypothetical protein [Clostridiales bacterium]
MNQGPRQGLWQQPVPPQPVPPTQTAPEAQAPLPDGVRMEPLDENTWKLLQGAGATAASGAAVQSGVTAAKAPALAAPSVGKSAGVAPPASPSAAAPGFAAKNSVARQLEDIMQDERNASVFYQYLSGTARREDYRDFLRKTGTESDRRHQLFNGLYQKWAPTAFQAKDADINTRVSFDDGISLAIVEEGNIIDKMNNIFESATDDKLSRTLFSQICHKIGVLNKLYLMCLNKNIGY